MKEDLPRYRVMEAYQSPYPAPMAFKKGELVEIGKKFTDDPDWKNWVWCRGQEGKQAWAPLQFLSVRGKTGTFLRDYNALELSVSEGETLTVCEAVNGFGMAEKADGTKGWVPLRNLAEISRVDR